MFIYGRLTCFICSQVSLKFRLFTCLTRLRMCVSGVFSWLSTFIILRINCRFLIRLEGVVLLSVLVFSFVVVGDQNFEQSTQTHTHTVRR